MGKKIVFCNCSSEIINLERLHAIEGHLKQMNADIIKISDLCGLSVLGIDKLKSIFNVESEYLIIGCYSRAMKLLLDKVSNNFESLTVYYLNFIEFTNEQLFQKISLFCESSNQENTFQEISTPAEWPSWFPVIDYSRCSTCGQCADFCLFGVYEKTEERVSVTNPQGCKNNCPACARICPQTAIIFPKYKQGGAISGSEVIDEIAEQKRQAMDIETIIGGDIYSALEQRKIKRQSIILNETMKKAIEEREKALKESGKL